MKQAMRRMLDKPWVSPREYHATMHGLQIVFGAVLGFVLARAEGYDPMAFFLLLLLTSGAVMAILYISASRHRFAYLVCALAYCLVLPQLVTMTTEVPVPEKLVPTLLIWTLMQGSFEFMPRDRSAD